MIPNIKVRVVSESGQPLPNVLVYMNTYLQGQYYYSEVIGLSDPEGLVLRDKGDIEAAFRRNQAMFPMDYKVDLGKIDAFIECGIVGGNQFMSDRDSTAVSGLVDPGVKQLYAAAENAKYRSASERVMVEDSEVDVTLVIK